MSFIPDDAWILSPEKLSRVPLVDKNTVSHCVRCSRSFSQVRRKHNCRGCGDVYCGDCSKVYKCHSISDKAFEGKVRYCNECNKAKLGKCSIARSLQMVSSGGTKKQLVLPVFPTSAEVEDTHSELELLLDTQKQELLLAEITLVESDGESDCEIESLDSSSVHIGKKQESSTGELRGRRSRKVPLRKIPHAVATEAQSVKSNGCKRKSLQHDNPQIFKKTLRSPASSSHPLADISNAQNIAPTIGSHGSSSQASAVEPSNAGISKATTNSRKIVDNNRLQRVRKATASIYSMDRSTTPQTASGPSASGVEGNKNYDDDDEGSDEDGQQRDMKYLCFISPSLYHFFRGGKQLPSSSGQSSSSILEPQKALL